jgi:threonine aldolase
MNFKSDNVVKIHPAILEAIIEANHGTDASYGQDAYSKRLEDRLSEIFEREVAVFLTNTGTVANCLGLAALVKPYESILCHKDAHINTAECGAPELFTGGAKLIPLNGTNGKISLAEAKLHVTEANAGRPHMQRPGAISLSQATESGTVYTLAELHELTDFAKAHQIAVQLDGARFANALVTLNCSPAEATWKVGVNLMSFGGTKNGALAAEAVIIFDKHLAETFDYIHKRGGQLMSKSRFFAAQFLAYLKNDLWLSNASHANIMAQQLAQIFQAHKVELLYPVEANELFVRLPSTLANKLIEKDVGFFPWDVAEPDVYRFVTSCFTTMEDIEQLKTCF